MIIKFADDFKIKLNSIPDKITEYLKEEIDEHIFSDDADGEYDIRVEFKNSIEFDNETKYITLGSGFSEKSFYLLDGMHNKIRIGSFREKKIVVEKNFNPKCFFEILEYLYVNKILGKNMMFLHSSGAVLEDKTIVFPACAGTGKTKMLIQLMKKYNATFLGDDWTIIDNKGNVYPYLRNIRFWANDILKQKEIFKGKAFVIPGLIGDHFDFTKKDKRSLRFIKKIYSNYLNKKLPIKIKAIDINKNSNMKYNCRNKIDYTIFFSRSNTAKINHESVKASVLTEKIICATLIENRLKPDYEDWAIFANQADIDEKIVQIQKMKSIMESCFQRTKNIWLTVPLKAFPDEIATYVIKEIISE